MMAQAQLADRDAKLAALRDAVKELEARLRDALSAGADAAIAESAVKSGESASAQVRLAGVRKRG